MASRTRRRRAAKAAFITRTLVRSTPNWYGLDYGRCPRHAEHVPSDAPPNRDKDDREREKGRVERLIKRLVETGVERLADSPETVRQWANELRLPKELMNAILTHVEDAKSEIFKVVVREVREFLERANLADEISRVLTGVTLEVKTQVRFVPNEPKSGRLQPTAKAGVSLTRDADDAASEQPNAVRVEEVQEKDI